MLRPSFFLVLLFSCLTAVAQKESVYQTENEKHIIWQPGVKLTFDMFQNTQPNEHDLAVIEKEHRQSLPYLGFWKVLDVPKKKSGWWNGVGEHPYFCAAFSKFQSFVVVRDSFDLEVAQLQWDIMELGTRHSRMILDSLQTTAVAEAGGKRVTGLISIYFYTAAKRGEELCNGYSKTVLTEAAIPRDHEKLLNHRKFVDEMLEQTSEYATRPEEAWRLLSQEPIQPDLKMAEKITGDLRKSKTTITRE